MEKDLFFCQEKNNYYCVGDYSCKQCNEPIAGILWIKVIQKKDFSYTREHYCLNCIENNGKFVGNGKILSAIIILPDKLPKAAYPVFDLTTFYTRTSMDVFTATSEKSEITINNCHHIHESLEGAQIGADVHERIEELDKPIQSVGELDNMFNDILNAEPMLPDKEETKKLEHDDGTA